MKQLQASFSRGLRNRAVPWIILAFLLVVSCVFYFRVHRNMEFRARVRFERLVTEVRETLPRRVEDCADALNTLSARFSDDRSLKQGDWARSVREANLARRLGDATVIGFIERVDAAGLEALQRRLRADGSPDFEVLPVGVRQSYFPVIHSTALEANPESRLGIDHFAEAYRREAMERAEVTRRPAMTTVLKPDDKQPGNARPYVIIYSPVYRKGSLTDTAAQRGQALRGHLFAVIDMRRLVAAVFDSPAESHVNTRLSDDSRLESEAPFLDLSARARSRAKDSAGALAQQVRLDVLGRKWTMQLEAQPGFAEGMEVILPWAVLVGSLSVSLLIFGVMITQLRARLQAEGLAQELHASQTALAAERNRLAVTLTSITDGVIATDTAGRVVSMNPAAERMTGWSQSEATGRMLPEMFCILHERTREPRENPVASVLRLAGVGKNEAGTILVARNGTERFIADAASPIRGDDDQQCGMVMVFRDITAQRKAEDRQMKESKLETIGSLAGGIAHDYNNILTVLVGNLSLARILTGEPGKLNERLDAAESSANRAKELTQQLLTFARGGSPIKRLTQLEPLLREATEFALHGAKVSCEVQISSELWQAEVDEGQLRHALNNVVLHGVRAMPEGGRLEFTAGNCEVREGEIAALRSGRYVRIVIRDHGKGFSADELPRIFDPYFSPKNPGSGLGLATAYSIIRKHGGELLAHSMPRQGTTFEVYLPTQAAASTPVAVIKPKSTADLKGTRVLIMDDEPGIREALGLLLELLGVESEAVRDGREALERYASSRSEGKPFAAVIMDLTIPNGMGGEEAVRLLKEFDPGACAIVSSGYSNDPVMAEYRSYGFDGVMPKPYQLQQLEDVLGRVLSGDADAGAANGEMQLSL